MTASGQYGHEVLGPGPEAGFGIAITLLVLLSGVFSGAAPGPGTGTSPSAAENGAGDFL